MITEEKVLTVLRAEEGRWLWDGKDNWVKELSTFGNPRGWTEKTQSEKEAWEEEKYNEANTVGNEQ